jgi:hypothetical protein
MNRQCFVTTNLFDRFTSIMFVNQNSTQSRKANISSVILTNRKKYTLYVNVEYIILWLLTNRRNECEHQFG